MTLKPLTAAALLQVWEDSLAQPLWLQGLTILQAASPGTSLENLAQLSIGQRDRRLLTLREWTFGPELTGLTSCPVCGARLEMNLSIPELRGAPEIEALAANPDPGGEVLSLKLEDYEIRCRRPNSLDIAMASRGEDLSQARTRLWQRCLVELKRQGEVIDVKTLPAEMVTTVATRLAEADPGSEIFLNLSCPECRHQWQTVFDIVSFFWHEIDRWARRLLREIHLLASAYGWREADILNLSPWRRQCYLEMVGA